MMKSAVLDFVREVIPEMKDIEPEDIHFETTIEGMALDSLDFVELQLAFKKRFGIEIHQRDFVGGDIKTVEDLCTMPNIAAAPSPAAAHTPA